MAILRIVNRGMDRRTYEEMRRLLDIDRKHPLGLIMHGVSEVDGVIQVAQIWDSAAYARRFDEDLLRPVLVSVDASTEASIAVFELEDLITP